MWQSQPAGSRRGSSVLENAGPLSVAAAGARAARKRFAGDARVLFLSALRAADCTAVAAAGIAAYLARNGLQPPGQGELLQVLSAVLLTANVLHFADIYTMKSLRDRAGHIRRLASGWAVVMLVLATSIYFAGASRDVSRGWMLLWAFGGLAGLMALRAAAWAWLASPLRRGQFVLNLAVVGRGSPAERLVQRLESGGEARVVGIFEPGGAAGEGDASAASQGINEFALLARRMPIDEVAISLPCADADDLRATLRKLSTVPVNVKLCPDVPDDASGSLVILPVAAAPVLQRPLAGWPNLIKRGMDLAIAGTLLIALAPLMALLALAIKLDSPGPTLFRQQRFGFNKNPITVYKFRTMHAAAALDPNVPQACRNDPRVTRVGRILRRTSFDELPQLLNVLDGTMSLVGPRPHAIVHDEHYAALIDGYLARHRVRPGITGWAQVNGYRGEIDSTEKMARRLEHDLFYIDHWSPLFDLYILFRTARIGFGDANAY